MFFRRRIFIGLFRENGSADSVSGTYQLKWHDGPILHNSKMISPKIEHGCAARAWKFPLRTLLHIRPFRNRQPSRNLKIWRDNHRPDVLYSGWNSGMNSVARDSEQKNAVVATEAVAAKIHSLAAELDHARREAETLKNKLEIAQRALDQTRAELDQNRLRREQ